MSNTTELIMLGRTVEDKTEIDTLSLFDASYQGQIIDSSMVLVELFGQAGAGAEDFPKLRYTGADLQLVLRIGEKICLAHMQHQSSILLYVPRRDWESVEG